jgi:hypothetical protein
MINSKKIDSCRELLKTMEILPFFLGIYFHLLYVLNIKHLVTKYLGVINNNITYLLHGAESFLRS